jgi:hypothetical protein
MSAAPDLLARGPTVAGRKISQALRRAVAYHEAGHAVAAYDLGLTPTLATIVPSSEFNGRVLHRNPLRHIRLDFDGSDRTRLRAERVIMILLAGPLAQRRAGHRSPQYGGGDDFPKAAALAMHVCGSDEQVDAFLKWLNVRARAILELRWPDVERVAQALLDRNTLRSREIVAVIESSN